MNLSTFQSLFTFLLLMVSHEIFPQSKNIIHSKQSWIQYYQQMKLNDHFIVMTDGGFRWRDGERLIYIARTGLGYQLSSRFRIAAGIASTGSYNTAGLNKFELRPYQEFLTSTNGKIGIQHRFRIEERYFKDVANAEFQSGHDFNFRFRYQVSVSIPIVKFSRENTNRQLLLNISDEIFVNAGKEIVYNFLDKNRMIIGPAVQASKNINVGLSYNFQFSQLNSPATYAHDDILWLTVKHQMDLSKRNRA